MPKLKRLNQVLLGLFVFFLPWQTAYIFDAKFIGGAKWQYGTGLIFATEILLWLIALLQLIIIIKNRKTEKRKLKISRPRMLVIISLWFLVAWPALSLLWAPEKSAGFYIWFHLLEAAGLFFIILISSSDKKKIYSSLALAGVLQALLALWQFFSQSIGANKWLGIAGHLPWQSGEIVIESSGRWLRAYGSFAHPNVLGGFLVICFFATIIPALAIDGRRNTPWRIIAALLLLAGIFFSFSRSAWLALVIGMVIIFIKEISRAKKSAAPANAKYRNLVKYFLAPLVLAVVLFFIYSPLVLTRASTTDRLETKSINERLAYFSQAGDLLKNHWPIGVGEGNYTYALYQANPTLPAWSYQPVHNVFVLIFAELGIVGIVIFIFLLISLFLNFLISKSSEKEKGSIAELAFFTTLLTIIIFDHYLWTGYVGLILLFMTLALILKRERPSD